MKRVFFIFALVFLVLRIADAQTPRTLVKTVSTLPTTCTSGVPQTDEVFKTGSGAGLYYCDSTNHWALVVTAGVPGIFQINGMTGSSQTISIGTSGTAPAIVSASNVTTINIPTAGAAATGTVTTGTQSFAGEKTFLNPLAISYGTGSGVALDIVTADTAGAAVNMRNNSATSNASYQLSNNVSKNLFLALYGSTATGTAFTNGPLNANNTTLQSSSNDISIGQNGSSGNLWFATNSIVRAKISSAGFALYGTTSGTSTIAPQAAAGSYVFQLPNTDPTVGQVVSINGFSAGTVTLGYSDGGSGLSGLYDLASQVDGQPGASQKVLSFTAARAFTLAVTGSVCGAGTAATAQSDFVISVNGTAKGTLRFAASGTTCTVVSPVGTSIAIGDKVKITAAASPDATLADLNFTLKSSTPDAAAYDLGQQHNGDFGASEVVLRFTAARAFTLPVTGSVCSADTAATAQTDFLVTVNGVTKGTLRFAASGTTCSIVSPTSVSVSIGDKVKIIGPASPDATLADVTFTLLGSNP